jgi:hypothetical protein
MLSIMETRARLYTSLYGRSEVQVIPLTIAVCLTPVDNVLLDSNREGYIVHNTATNGGQQRSSATTRHCSMIQSLPLLEISSYNENRRMRRDTSLSTNEFQYPHRIRAGLTNEQKDGTWATMCLKKS